MIIEDDDGNDISIRDGQVRINGVLEEDLREPPPGSWAAVARMMSEGDDSDFDWDAWKDEMKENE